MVLNRELHVAAGEVLLVRKPAGWTSFDVVNAIRHMFGVKKVGHAGTLDPMATGLLIVCTGRKTKEISGFMGLDKEYEAEMMLGGRTASYDAATPVLESRSTDGLCVEEVQRVLVQFVGPQVQSPPMWSAVKVGGERLYKYARKGEEIERKLREIVVHAIVPTLIRVPVVRFTVTCSKGTYIRGLVHDMGQRLGCGAYLTALERTRIGDYRLTDAMTLEELRAYRAGQERGEG